MSAKSLIGIQRDDFHVEYVYCNSNGYPENVGKLLLENYCDDNLLDELLSFGDISSLGETTKDSIFYNRDKNKIEFSTKSRQLPLDIYIKESSIENESFRYLLNLEGKLMCYDIYEDTLMEIESFI